MVAFVIFVLLPAGLFFVYVLVNFGAEFRRNAHVLGRPGVSEIPVQGPYAVSAAAAPSIRQRSLGHVIEMKVAEKPAERAVAQSPKVALPQRHGEM